MRTYVGIPQGGGLPNGQHQGGVQGQGPDKEVEAHLDQTFHFLVDRKDKTHADIGLFEQQQHGKYGHGRLGDQTGPCGPFQIHGGNQALDSIDQGKVKDQVQQGPDQGDDHGVKGVLQPPEDAENGKGQEGERKAPCPNGVIGDAIVQDFSTGIEEAEYFLDDKNGGTQDQKAQQQVEIDGLGGEAFDLFEFTGPQILGNDR